MFLNNNASYKGAIYLISPGKSIIIDHCIFSKNMAEKGAGIYLIFRGLIYKDTIFNVSITNCYFSQNSADYGSALFFEQESNY